MIPGKPEKELEPVGKDDEIAEQGAAHEKDRGEKNDGQKHPALGMVKPGRHEHPELIEDHRGRQPDPRQKGHFQISEKCLGKTGEDQGVVFSHHPDQRRGEDLEEPFLEEVADDKADRHGDKDVDQAGPELLEVSGKGELVVFIQHGRPLCSAPGRSPTPAARPAPANPARPFRPSASGPGYRT